MLTSCAAEKPLSICGELATNEAVTEQLLTLGITEFSVSPHRVPFVKKKLRDVIAVQ
jgi:phosphoenolpyruvate-protein kinase (PTS system EI component)